MPPQTRASMISLSATKKRLPNHENGEDEEDEDADGECDDCPVQSQTLLGCGAATPARASACPV
jgi:hypothetical protein